MSLAGRWYESILLVRQQEKTCCYTEEEAGSITCRKIPNSDELEWVSLFDLDGPPITPPCDHSWDECPAKKLFYCPK
jgi:hypothetical protein